MTVAQLARRIGISQSYLSDLENQKHKMDRNKISIGTTSNAYF
ncbi:helix-turn-helix transcriptional regulator [Clostridium tagluense]|nr:helix-turn-helix transcriptional regulator [Clostridium tagluense]MCB2325206.1 helix-turn-helix transcriptional regulator [Clostridium tagluense]MCB2330058.1 helix-turn-helix transcriptional regulator [Clostridium tagluense]MCB2334915.1 helix-turn-helix transcriptional regulator [Clostridium tagluense]MCB2363707.1 helix-turn-helix transcriptional regulator [Clostridium tagluense]